MLEKIITDLDRSRAAYVEHDLKPCPFCGKSVLSASEKNVKTNNFVATILCAKCLAKMVCCEDNLEKAQQQVKERWNKRV